MLWIERESAVREQVAHSIATLGYQVNFASSAGAALALLARDLRSFDVVVVDAHLPDELGLELAQHLRAARDDWAVLLCAEEDDCAWLINWVHDGDLPCDALVLKPVDPSELELALRNAKAARAWHSDS